MSGVHPPLTKAQIAALAKLEAEGTVYPYNGVSVSTAVALDKKGLAVFTQLAHGDWTLT